MGWNTAPPHVWSDLFNIDTIEDVQATLKAAYSIYKTAPWSMDQTILQKQLESYRNLKVMENLDLYAIDISSQGIFGNLNMSA